MADGNAAPGLPTNLLQYGRIERIRVERGQPRDNVVLSGNYNLGPFGALLRTQRFGKVTTAGVASTDTLDQTFSAKWITDASVSLTLTWRVVCAL